MNKMKQNIFWVAMAAAGAALVIVFVLMVLPKMTEQTKLQGRLKNTVRELDNAKAELPGNEDIEAYNKYRDGIIKSYQDIAKFYTDSDKQLERWFPNLATMGDYPPRDSFMTRFRDDGKSMEQELGKKGTKMGFLEDEKEEPPKRRFGFSWEGEDPNTPMWQGVTPDEEKVMLRELQKRFWARQRVANMVLNSNVKVSRVLDFCFFKKLHPRLANAPWETRPTQTMAIHYQGVGGAAGGRMAFQEFALPNELGTTLTFGFALELPYSEVPKAIREILNPGAELINLIGTHITIREQNNPMVEYKFTERDQKQEMEAKEKAKKEVGKARDVVLAVTCQIIDFDPAKVKQFGAKAPAGGGQ